VVELNGACARLAILVGGAWQRLIEGDLVKFAIHPPKKSSLQLKSA